MTTMKKSVYYIFFIFLLAISGCGYTTGSLLPAHIKTIYVQPFRDRIELTKELSSEDYRFRSYTPHLETDISKEIISKIINDGHLKVVAENEADVILSGDLYDYLRQPVRYGSDNETVEEYRLSVICLITVKDAARDKILWNAARIIGDATYSLSGTYASSESSAISAAVSDLARRVVNRIVEGW